MKYESNNDLCASADDCAFARPSPLCDCFRDHAIRSAPLRRGASDATACAAERAIFDSVPSDARFQWPDAYALVFQLPGEWECLYTHTELTAWPEHCQQRQRAGGHLDQQRGL